MKSGSWKGAERRFARDIGSERKPCDGSRAGADFEDTRTCYQLKVRKAIPSWLWGWLAGIQETAAKSERCGVLVLKHPRQRDDEALIVMAWKDWLAFQQDACSCGSDRPESARYGHSHLSWCALAAAPPPVVCSLCAVALHGEQYCQSCYREK